MEVPQGNGRFEKPFAFQQTGTVLLPLPGTSIGPRGSSSLLESGAFPRRRSLNCAPKYGNPISETEHEPLMEHLIYGIHPVRECLRSGSRPISCLYIARGTGSPGLQAIVRLAKRQGRAIRFETRNVLDHRVGGANHQGVVAVCTAQLYVELEDLLDGLGPAALVVVLDSVEDPRNLGAVLRSCAAAGVDGVIITKDHAAGLTTTVSKAAAGGLEYLSIARVINLARAIDQLKRKGIWVAGVETGQPLACQDLDLTLATALVLGNEGVGLRRLVREKCDFLASIPTPGPLQSLNLSVAAGIVLYEAIRQRGSERGSGGNR